MKEPMILVPIGKATQKRNKVKDLIGLHDLFDGIKTGRWKSEVSPVRKLDKTDPKYELQKKLAHAVWLQAADLMVFDYDHGKLDIPKKFILARCKSIGGTGEMIIMRTPSENREQYRRWIQYKYNFKDGQTSDDRCRFVSWDPDIKVNWKAEIDLDTYDPNWQDQMTVAASEHNPSLAPEYYQQAKDKLVPLDNTTALAVYSWLRHRSISHMETTKLLEECLFKTTGSMTTKQKRLRYYQKWAQQYEPEFPIPIKQIKTVAVQSDPIVNLEKLLNKLEGEYEPDWYCTDDEQIDVMLQTALGPFVPLHIDWFDKQISVCTGTVLSGPPSSGKGTIHDMIKPFIKEFNKVSFELSEHVVETIMNIKLTDDKKARKLVPNISTVLGFDSSDAALYGSLSEVRCMLLYGNEIGALIGSSKAEHNNTRIASILSFLEGESTVKMLKKNDLYGKTQFLIDEPLFGLLSGGTPETVAQYFSKHIDDGLVSRILFLVLKPTDLFNQKTFKKVNPVDHINSEDLLRFVKGDYKTQLVSYNSNHVEKIKRQLHDRYLKTAAYSGILRGIRNCIKRSAVQLWIEGQRKKFFIPNESLDWQVNVLIKSLDYINSFSEHSTDRFGRSTFNDNLKLITQIDSGQYVPVQHGIAIDKKTVQAIKKLYEQGISISDLSKKFNCSRPTIYKILKS